VSCCLSCVHSILAQQRLLCLPVQAKDSVDIIGFVDVLDVLTHIVRLCSEGKSHPEADEAFEYASGARTRTQLQRVDTTHARRRAGTRS
jgi:hypothetical protein